MDKAEFTTRMPGTWARSAEGHDTFLPNVLPRSLPIQEDLLPLMHRSSLAVGRLIGALQEDDGLNTGLLLRPLLQREATLSSRIEGTVAVEEDLALFAVEQAVESRIPDVREVANYLAALEWGVGEVKNRSITSNLIRQLHQRLLDQVRGEDQTPGQFRRCQVLIGSNGQVHEARFVPPPWLHIPDLIDDLVAFMGGSATLPPLIRAAMTHYQFETIHPFRDGNGRVGRLLIALQIMRDLEMPVPALHMSPYFERNRRAYYDGLLALSQTGNWLPWITYFLSGIVDQANDTVNRVGALRRLRAEYRAKFQTARGSALLLKVIDLLFTHPGIDVRFAAGQLGVTYNSAQKHVERLVDAGILDEVTGRDRGRVYLARDIIRVAREAVALPG